jgi:hypothetical protein
MAVRGGFGAWQSGAGRPRSRDEAGGLLVGVRLPKPLGVGWGGALQFFSQGGSRPMSEQAFEHAASFEQIELSGNVRLGKFEAQYEELFAVVIEDGVITAEERAQLDRAADAMGLDRARLQRLEQALQAAYEARHQVKIRDHSGFAADDAAPMSLAPLAPATDPRTMALERRVKMLEGRVRELEAQLDEARSQMAVEVDLSDVAPAAVRPSHVDDPAELLRRLRHDPRDGDLLRGLFRAYGVNGDVDRRFCVAQTLSFLGLADGEAQAFEEKHRVLGLIRPTQSLTQDGWRRLLFHPDEEVLTGEIFSVIVSAVLLGRVSALRRDKLIPTLKPEQLQDPAKSTVLAVKCFGWAAALLGMRAPSLYIDPTLDRLIEMVPGVPPVSRLGKKALSGRDPEELAFVAGRHLSFYREEHFVRMLIPSIPDLEDLFLAALVIGNPGIPLGPDVKQRVLPISKAIEPILEPILVDRLRGYFLRFVEDGGRTNLLRWANAADRTSSRAGLLLSGSLSAAKAMLELEDSASAADRLDDLLVFQTSDRYANLRKQIGIALPTAG